MGEHRIPLVCESSLDFVASGKVVRLSIRSGNGTWVGIAERRDDLQNVVGREAGELLDRRDDDFVRTIEQMSRVVEGAASTKVGN